MRACDDKDCLPARLGDDDGVTCPRGTVANEENNTDQAVAGGIAAEHVRRPAKVCRAEQPPLTNWILKAPQASARVPVQGHWPRAVARRLPGPRGASACVGRRGDDDEAGAALDALERDSCPRVLWGEVHRFHGGPRSLFYHGDDLLVVGTTKGFCVFGAALDGTDMESGEYAMTRGPILSIGSVPFVSDVAAVGRDASAVEVVVASRRGLELYDVEDVDVVDPRPVVSSAVPLAPSPLHAAVESVVAVQPLRESPSCIASVASRGSVFLWDTRRSQPATVMNPQSSVVGLSEQKARAAPTCITQNKLHEVTVGDCEGHLATYDMRKAGAAMSVVNVTPILAAATNGALSVTQSISSIRVLPKGSPGTVVFNTLSGFVGVLPLGSDDDTEPALLHGSYMRDGVTHSIPGRIAVSDHTSLVACPRVDKSAVSFIKFPRRSQLCTFHSNVYHVAFHPRGETVGGVMTADGAGRLWHIDIGNSVPSTATESTTSSLP